MSNFQEIHKIYLRAMGVSEKVINSDAMHIQNLLEMNRNLWRRIA